MGASFRRDLEHRKASGLSIGLSLILTVPFFDEDIRRLEGLKGLNRTIASLDQLDTDRHRWWCLRVSSPSVLSHLQAFRIASTSASALEY